MKLLIVESPNKCKKIKSFLDNDWEVVASVGHIRDLPHNKLGYDDSNFKPNYEITPDKRKVVSSLKKRASNASEIYIATDPDREGEAIAFHLEKCLNLRNYKRVTFNEITKTAISNAISNPRKIDYNLVKAQEARRVLDRMVGYLVSPLLTKSSGTKLSAGRVQSPAVKLVSLREDEIKKFIMRNFYTVEICIEGKIKASLIVEEKYLSGNERRIFNQDICYEISKTTKKVILDEVIQKPVTIKPRKPFTTSSLQQAASQILKISPAETMKLAQKLFELGAITYHRTDTPNISSEFFKKVSEYLLKINVKPQNKQITWNTKDNAQEAHEAVRPTDIEVSDIDGSEDAKKLYRLIRERTLVSAASEAVENLTQYVFLSIDESENFSHAKFIAEGTEVIHEGWRGLCNIEKVKKDKAILPKLNKNRVYTTDNSIIKKQTKPPSRFNEASLIKAMESLGIGRPSTYAAIIENIKNRGYVSINSKGFLVITEKGTAIKNALNNMTFMNLSFTQQLEKALDKISEGKSTYFEIVSGVNKLLSEEINYINIDNLSESEITECPLCKQDLIRKNGKFGYFWVHCDDHECEDSFSDSDGVPIQKNKHPVEDCPACGKKIKRLKKRGKNEYFWVHIDDRVTGSCTKFISDKDVYPEDSD